MSDENVQVQEQSKAPEVQPDPEAARYAQLEQELEADESGQQEQPVKQDAKRGTDGKFKGKADEKPLADESDGKEAKAGDEKPKPSYEELYNNTQKALREERTARQSLEEKLNGINSAVAQLRERRQPKAEQQIPDVHEDPIGHFTAQLALRDKQIEELKSGSQKTADEIESDRNERQFWNAVVQSEAKIRETTDDYDAAVQHLESGRVAELQVMFPDDDPQAQALARQYSLGSVEELRTMVLNQDRVTVAQMAMRLGKSPAQMYYDLALKRGYVKADKPNGKANGKALDEARDKIETARRGQKAAKSISGGEGGKADAPLTIADLVDLYDEDQEEFDKVFEQMKRQGLLG